MEAQVIGIWFGIATASIAGGWGAVKGVAWVVAYFAGLTEDINAAHMKIQSHVDRCGPRYREIAHGIEKLDAKIERSRAEHEKLDAKIERSRAEQREDVQLINGKIDLLGHDLMKTMRETKRA